MQPEPSGAGEACERFFSIDELVALFLHQAPTLVLVNCQRVCTLWHSIITTSPALQKSLFLLPSSTDSPSWSEDEEEPDFEDEEDFEARFATESTPPEAHRSSNSQGSPKAKDRILNPVLAECFAPILASSNLGNSTWSFYSQLQTLPWAKTGTQLDSPARNAFAREEASWRQMLVSQPPIYRLDWWHEWATADNAWWGWGHQDLGTFGNSDSPITLGMLWDLVEGRLRRGCSAQVVYFPAGQAVDGDATATETEKEWARGDGRQHHGFTKELPRIKLMTRQVWAELPKAREEYNMQLNRWVVGAGYWEWLDGFNTLRQDCGSRDRDAQRWSRSEGFERGEIHGESSSGANENDTGRARWSDHPVS